MLVYLLSITPIEHHDTVMYIYNTFYKLMFKTAYRITRDHHLSEDIVQASFERIIKKINYIEDVSRNGLRSYTVFIVRSVAINTITKEKKYKLEPNEDLELLVGSDGFDTAHNVIINEQIREVRRCLNQMDERYANAILLRDYYHYSDSQTAELLGIRSASTVRSLCYRGRKKIMEIMTKEGDSNE